METEQPPHPDPEDPPDEAAPVDPPGPSTPPAEADEAQAETASGTTTPPPKSKPSKSTGADSDSANGQRSFNHRTEVFQQFIGSVGTVNGTEDGTSWQQRDGILEQERLARLLRHFVPPSRYDDALTALHGDHVVTIHGRTGLGKYAGGVHLLRDVTEQPIILLAPVMKLKQLAGRPFTEGYGYLIVDWQIENRTAETEFAWLTVRNQVREAGAFLVITSTSSKPVGSEVQHLEWQAPDLRRVLRAHAKNVEIGDEIVDEVLEYLSSECSMTDLITVAGRLGDGEDHKAVLADYDDGSAAEDVRAWFEEPRDRRETLVVATLAFAEREPWRTFERLVSRLAEEVAVTIPEPVPPANAEPAPVNKAMPEPRRLILSNPLVAQESVAGNRQIIKFRKPGYRRRVLIELWSRYDADFWDAVREWACDMVDNFSLRPAAGLAALASINFDEVCQQFLDPWAGASQGIPGQVAATYVLWNMCTDDATAPIALGTATRWANHGDPAQRWTAALTFTGLLGVCYPNEAIRQLWQLVVNAGGGTEPWDALGLLFANLTYVGSPNASKVLSMLNGRIDALENPRPDAERPLRNVQHLRNLTLTSTLGIVSIRDAASGRSVIFKYLHDHFEDAPAVARLWAALLRNRRYRRPAIEALWEGLNALPQISKEPTVDANVLGEALAKTLPEVEHGFLAQDLTTVDRFKRKGKNLTPSMAVVLLEALERLYPHRKDMP